MVTASEAAEGVAEVVEKVEVLDAKRTLPKLREGVLLFVLLVVVLVRM